MQIVTSMNDSELSTEGIRLQKVLANAGVASRRVCEDLIVAGAVKVNGKQVKELGTRVNPEVDKITVRGTPIQLDATRVYLMLNKPYGVVSTMSDEQGRPDLNQYTFDYDRVFNVGRLDAETTGLLLMTNDGDLAHKLMHPSFEVSKTYQAKLEGAIPQSSINKLLKGLELEDGFIKADKARVMSTSNDQSMVKIELHSGRNRIVRRMFDALGFPVIALVRRQFGPLHLGNLKSGAMRELTKIELGALLKAANRKGDKDGN
jgi:23S rRNA pseudouridine2605 synthase